jgi:hypothetical protein
MTTPDGNAGNAGTGAPNPGAGAPAAAPTNDWTTGLNDEMKGFVQSKGFKDPASVLDSYRNLEKFHGVPQERLLKLPEKEEGPEWDPVYERLGKPKDAKEYNIEIPEKYGNKEFAEWARSTFHELGLTKKQAEKLSAKWNQHIDQSLTSRDQQYQQDLVAQDKALEKEWGQAYTQNIDMAKSAAAKFGIDKETIDKLESAMGFAGVMKFMHRIGSGLGEHKFVDNGKGGGKIMTPAAAKYEIDRLKMDQGFAAKVASGDSEAIEKWTSLHKMAFAAG